MTVCTISKDHVWPNGEVPLVVPRVWAANEPLLNSVHEAMSQLNCLLRGHVSIRTRRPGDRDYLVLHATRHVLNPTRHGVGRQGGAQDLNCKLRSLVDNPTPIPGTIVRELCRALGVHHDFLPLGQCSLNPFIIDGIKQLYPRVV